MSKKGKRPDSVDTLEALEQLHKVVKSCGNIKAAESLEQCLDEWRAMHKVLEVENPSIKDVVKVWKLLDKTTSRSVRCISSLIAPQAHDSSTSSDESSSEGSDSDNSSSSSSSERSKDSSSSSSSSSSSEDREQHITSRYVTLESGQGNVPKLKSTSNVSSPSSESETDSDSSSSSSDSQVHAKKDLSLNSRSDKPRSSASSASSSSSSSSSSAAADSSSSSSSSSSSDSDSGTSSTLRSKTQKDEPPKKKRKTESGVKIIKYEDTAASKAGQAREESEDKRPKLLIGSGAETTNGSSKASSSSPATSTPNTVKIEKKVKQPRKNNVPFQRIKVDRVEFTDERLKDNSFHSRRAKPGDYGERAHADLIVTRGDSFRKEKNKKKRGSYRGGEITLESHSIKFT